MNKNGNTDNLKMQLRSWF